MSFFRNLRSSITRGRSSSRDTTPVRTSRAGSIISSLNSGSSSKRRDSIESRCDSSLNRSDTFILDDPDATPNHSNSSTLEKKSKKSKVLEKFSTFTKRKKNPSADKAAFEHHPSDNATNTYYKWQAEGGGNSLDYDSQNDPFNFLYEQQSSLKSLHNAAESTKSNSSSSPNGFDSSTYRAAKMPTDLRKQLRMLKDQDTSLQEGVIEKKVQVQENKNNNENGNDEEEVEVEVNEEAEVEDDHVKADKYKTVTLNSFRRSFREKFLQQQREAAAYNPAWFVDVKTQASQKNDSKPLRDSSKENRRDLLVFENENYRPGSKSPIRDLNSRKEVRTSTRSPVKRNETFKVERFSRLDQQAAKPKIDENTNSIHIEFKNSITPHVPGRMVPVGVAKPMPSRQAYTNYYRKIDDSLPLSTNYANKPPAGSTVTRLNNHSPIRSPWLRSQSPPRTISSNANRLGRYQTLVQIKNEKPQQNSPITVRQSRLSTRIQVEPSRPERKAHGSAAAQSPSFGKRHYSAQLLNSNSGRQAHPLKQTYFAETPATATITQIPTNLSGSTGGLRTRQTATSHYGGYKYHSPSIFASTSSLATTPAPATSVRTTPAHSVSNICSSSNNNQFYLKQSQKQQQHQLTPQQHQQQQRTRLTASGQRRSRSPIKIPWR